MPKKKSVKPKVKKAVKKPAARKKTAAKLKPKPKMVSSLKSKAAAAVKASPEKPKEAVVAGTLLGEVEDYYGKVGVIAVTLKDALSSGDTIRVKGHTTDIVQKVESMQIAHAAISAAKAGDPVGIKMNDRCRKGDKVYRI